MTKPIGQGQVVAILPSESFGEELLIVKNEKETVYINEEESGCSNAINCIGATVTYQLEEKIGSRQFASIKKMETQALCELKERFENNPDALYEGEVVHVENDRVRLRVENCFVRLDRYDLIDEPLTMKELLNVGDRLTVKIKVIQNDYIQVEAHQKLQRPNGLQLEDLREGDLVLGVVSRTKVIRRQIDDSYEKANHVFVTIAKGVDLLAPLQAHRPVEAGQTVVVKLNQISPDGRTRGKVLRILTNPAKQKVSLSPAETAPQIGEIKTGRVKLVREVPATGEKILFVDCQSEWIQLPTTELSPYDGSKTDLGWIGSYVNVQVTQTTPQLVGSKRQADLVKRQNFIQSWENKPWQVKKAYVQEVGRVGYILIIDREEVFMLKSDYRTLYPEAPELEPREKIAVQLKDIQGEIIHVRPATSGKEELLQELGLTPETLANLPREELPVFDAEIVKIRKKGAYLKIGDHQVYMPNMLFSLGQTRVKDIYREGDIIKIRPQSYRDNQLVVCACPRLVDEGGVLPEELTEGLLAYGVVRKIHESTNPETGEPQTQIFTSIGFKLEGLSPKSPYFEVEEGDPVVFRVHQIRENGAIRGKIVRALTRLT